MVMVPDGDEVRWILSIRLEVEHFAGDIFNWPPIAGQFLGTGLLQLPGNFATCSPVADSRFETRLVCLVAAVPGPSETDRLPDPILLSSILRILSSR